MSLYIKGGIILAIVTTIFFGYRYVVGLQNDVELLTTQNTALKISNEAFLSEMERTDALIASNDIAIKDLNEKIKESRERTEEVLKLFGRHDFTNLVQKKPELIEKKINKATEGVFKELEDISK